MADQSLPLPPELLVEEEPFSADALDLALSGELAENETVDRWQITDLGGAAWAAARWAEASAEIDAATLQAEQWRQRIADWLEDTTRKATRTASFFAGHLERYALDERERTGKATLHLPSAVVRTTARKAKAVIAKEDEVLAWAEEFAPEVVRRDIAKAAFNERVKIAEVIDHYEHHVSLACGHQRSVIYAAKEIVPELASCFECPPEAGLQPVIASETETHHSLAVVDAQTGEVVPGTDVDPATVTASVKPA